MGSGASTAIAAGLSATSADDLKKAMQGLSPEDISKIKSALEASTAKAECAPSHPVEGCEPKEGGKTVLVIAASPMGPNSATNNVGAAFIKAYKEKFPADGVKLLDISKPGAIPPFTAARVQSKFKLFGGDAAAADGDKEWAETKQLIEMFKAADKYVFLAPMWNLWLPYSLKLFIDHIVQPGLTFGVPDIKGLVTGKPAMVIRASGGVPVASDMDVGYAYLKAVLGFIGFSDIRLVGISGTANPDGLAKLLEEKSKEAAEMAGKFEFDAEAKIEGPTKGLDVAKPEPAAIKEGAKVLFITCSPLGEMSVTKTAASKFVDVLKEKSKAEIVTLDLSDGKLEDFTAARVQAKFATWMGGKDSYPEDVKRQWEVTIALIEQFKSADVYVFAVPMWNLSIPYNLKQWFDHVAQPHRTFDPKTNTGLLEGKRAFVIACSGNGLLGGPMDNLTTIMKAELGFLGVSDVAYCYVKNKDTVQESVDELTKLCSV